LHFEDGTSDDIERTGKQLMSVGLPLRLVHPLSSALVFLAAEEETK
jgi:hypothetical protein